jgi:long-chain acyl-CoA synthetase
MHEAFESASEDLKFHLLPSLRIYMLTSSAAGTRYPNNRCLGWREKDATGTWGPFVWMDYMTVQERRKNLGAGIVHLEEELGVRYFDGD